MEYGGCVCELMVYVWWKLIGKGLMFASIRHRRQSLTVPSRPLARLRASLT